MYIHPRNAFFENTSQRVAYSYLASLAEFTPVIPSGYDPQQGADLEASERDLLAFYRSFYTALFQAPEQFGLPLVADMCIVGDEADPKQFKQDVKRKLDRPRILIERGLDFLMLAGIKGTLSETALLVEQETYASLVKETKLKKPFLSGLADVGMEISDKGGQVAFTSSQFPAMFLALKRLAEACLRYADKGLGRFNFARCDFRAMDGQFTPAALDLFQIFHPEDCERASRLHQFMAGLRYKPVYQIYGIFGWEVQYQGPSKIKSTPLLRIQYDHRHKNPLQTSIKCASANRITPLISQQPHFLQEDFARRVYNCRGDECRWCEDKKGLGPSEFELDGVRRTICWYHNPDVPELNEESLRLIQQYALMHEALAVSA